jgi:hypothetical protein
MIVDAVGTVPLGEDLGAAPVSVLVCPLAGRAVHELRLDVPAYGTYPHTAVLRDGSHSTSLSWKNAKVSLALELAAAGYVTDATEIDELVGAIDGVGQGPKATRMHGQTHAISVVATDFAGPRAPARCTP